MNHVFKVDGMTCAHCEKAVTQALLALDPQASVAINRSQNEVCVLSEKTRDALAQTIVDEGYRVLA